MYHLMDVLFTVLAYAGVVLVLFQTWPYFFSNRSAFQKPALTRYPKVSVIIPARNEENPLPALLNSLFLSDYPDYEVIVVDDQSSDLTFQVACAYPVKAIKAPPKPNGWIGKSWACHIGAQHAEGALLLFTDADTTHQPDGLRKAVDYLASTGDVMISAPSYHKNNNWWEKLLGPFYFLVTVAATPYNKPSLENPYAIGQYLLFDKNSYLQMGGHAAIKSSLAEDVDLARLILTHQQKYSIYTHTKLYEVQMYADFQSFTSGWNRLLRLGMQYMGFSSVIISFLSIFALTSCFTSEINIIRLIPTVITLFCIGVMQRKMGNFNIWGILLFPFSLLLFMGMGLRAALFHMLNIPLVWRGRVYKQPAGEGAWAGRTA